MIELLKVILLGIVEGITEWLPISSTGHMILLNEFIHLDVSERFFSVFEVVIQLGAILAVVILFFEKLWPFSTKKSTEEKKDTWVLWFKVIVSCLPAAVLGFLLDDWLDEHLYNFQTVAVTLVLYGILFILIERWNKNRVAKYSDVREMSYKIAFMIGVFQVLAMIPGTSRSGATILGAILLGCSREVAAEFTFFLAIPVMFGASLLKIVKFGLAFSSSELMILFVGMLVAFIVSVITIKVFMGYIKKKDFTVFGYYRIILGMLVLFYYFFH